MTRISLEEWRQMRDARGLGADDVLSMWTIYDHPTDFPNSFVARRFDITAEGGVATDNFIVAPTLEDIRERMVRLGLTPLTRSEQDEPQIVEVWL